MAVVCLQANAYLLQVLEAKLAGQILYADEDLVACMVILGCDQAHLRARTNHRTKLFALEKLSITQNRACGASSH